jgi:hypothetical protein
MSSNAPVAQHEITRVSSPKLAWFSAHTRVVVEWPCGDNVPSTWRSLVVKILWGVWGTLLLAVVSLSVIAQGSPLLFLLGLLVGGYALFARIFRRRSNICPEVEYLVGQVSGMPVSVLEASKGVSGPGPLPAGGAVRRWLDTAILKFGRMSDTPADRRVLRLWLAEEMKRADMRDADAVRLIPTVVEFMFIPGIEEFMAKMVRESCAKATLLEMYTTPAR